MGFLDDYQRPGTEMVPGIRVVGHPTAVLEVAKSHSADEVIIIAGALAWESQQHLAELVDHACHDTTDTIGYVANSIVAEPAAEAVI